MEIYLNNELLYENADSIKFYNSPNYFYDDRAEYYHKEGEYFTVTVNFDKSHYKNFQIKRCMIVRSQDGIIGTFANRYCDYLVKVYLSN